MYVQVCICACVCVCITHAHVYIISSNLEANQGNWRGYVHEIKKTWHIWEPESSLSERCLWDKPYLLQDIRKIKSYFMMINSAQITALFKTQGNFKFF